MKENIKIALLAVIAATLVIDTFIMEFMEKGDSSAPTEAHDHTAAPNAVNPASSAAALPSSPAEPAKPAGPVTSFKFEKDAHDFGKIKQESVNKYKFKFTNSGQHPLIIENAVGSCGCTVPTYPKDPIAPGQTNEIEVEYKPGKQQGSQAKTVTITANTEPRETRLQINAFVEEMKDK